MVDTLRYKDWIDKAELCINIAEEIHRLVVPKIIVK